MAYTEIKAGQRDWLSGLNQMLKGDSFNVKNFQCTMMNGASGWGNERILYNADVYVAEVESWFKLPANNIYIDFMDNPLSSVMSFGNNVLSQAVCLAGDGGAADAGYGRVIANAALDNKTAWGVYSTESSAHTYAKTQYNGFLHLGWIGSRGELNL